MESKMKKLIALIFVVILLVSFATSIFITGSEKVNLEGKYYSEAPVKLPPVPPRD